MTSPAGLSIRVPSQTPERARRRASSGPTSKDVFTWADGDVEFTFRSQTIPEAAAADGPESVLDAARDAFVKREISGSSLHSERRSPSVTSPSGRYQIHALALRPNPHPRVRSVVVGSQLYEQYADHLQGRCIGAGRRPFLRSR